MSNKEVPKLEKVIQGSAGVKKQSGLRRVANSMFTDNVGSAKEHVIYDILIPSAKNFALETVKSFLGMNGGNYRGYSGAAGSVNYNRPSYSNYSNNYSGASYNNYNRPTVNPNQGIQYENLVVNTKAEADEVLAALNDAICRYQFATVGNLYQLCGRVDYPYVYDNYGWMSVANAYAVANLDGTWSFKLPRAVPIQ